MSYTTLRIILLFGFTAAVVCVPTSILAKNSELNSNQNLKVKRSSNANGINNKNRELSLNTLAPLNDFNYEKANFDSKTNSISTGLIKTGKNSAEKKNADASGGGNDTPTMLLHKRGINSELMYGGGDGGYGGRGSFSAGGNNRVTNDNTADAYNIAIPNGIWMDDEIDPALVYSDLPDLDDYPRGQYRAKAYDNLQNLLSSEAYLEPLALPFRRYGNNRYYGPDNRKKRSNHNSPLSKYEIRLKRESKLTPADMLALVALVEAGERSRNEANNDDNDDANVIDPYAFAEQYRNQKMFIPDMGYQNKETKNEYNSAGDNDRIPNAWLEPAVLEYYGMPYNVEMLPKYDVAREQNKYGQNRYPAKRFMISKKKRSLERYLNEPIQKSSVAKSFKPTIVQKYF